MRFVAALAIACSGQPGDPDGSASSSDTEDPCEGVTVQPFSLDQPYDSAQGLFSLAFVQAEPELPFDGLNTWTVQLADLPGAELVLTPFMSVHGHGTSPPDYVASESEPGVYTVGPFDLIMPGPWEFTFTVGAGDQTDTLLTTFCVDG